MTELKEHHTRSRALSGATAIRVDFTDIHEPTPDDRAYELAVRRNLDRAMWRAQDRASAFAVALPQRARGDAPIARLNAPRRRTAPTSDDDAHAIGGAW